MRQVLPMFRANGESHRAKMILCGIEVDDRLQDLVQQEGAELIAVSHPAELARYGSEADWGCLVAGDAMLDGDALEAVAGFARLLPGYSWIVWSSKLDWPAAVGAMQAGAFHVLRCPHDDAALPASLASAIQLARERFVGWRDRNDVSRRYAK